MEANKKDIVKFLNSGAYDLMQISLAWEQLEATSINEVLCEKYPFNEDFREVVCKMIEWTNSVTEKLSK